MRNSNAPTAPVPLKLRVFLSSPGDLTDERKQARDFIVGLQAERTYKDKLQLELVAWDTPGAATAMPAHLEPQEALERDLLKPSACDIVIVIFGYRMGTPLSNKFRKPNGEPYLSGTEYEYLDALDAAGKQDGVPEILVYRKKGAPDVNAADPQRNEKLEQWDRVVDFFADFKNPNGSSQRFYREYGMPSEFMKWLGEELRDRIARRLEKYVPATEPSAPTREPDWTESPFPGLRAFREGEERIFFGRERETDELLQRLSDPSNRSVVVIGTSGSGKSSLVAAGLLPRLGSDAVPGSQDWILDVKFTPGEIGDDAVMALAAQLAPKLEKNGWRARELADELRAKPEKVGEFTELILRGRPDWAELLLFVDQFEELFTLVSPQHAASFVRVLDQAARTERLRIVATLRADFYHRCLEWPELPEWLLANVFPLLAPGIGALHKIINLPAERAGLTFENGLADKLLQDAVEEPGALALLAFALAELYDARQEPTGMLTNTAYDSFGGLKGAITERAEATFKAIDADAQATGEGVFRELVKVDERGVVTRQRALLDSFAGNEAARRLIDAFIQNRLLVTGQGESHQPVVEVAHEVLLQNWPRLQAWVETTLNDRRLLAQMRLAAQQWDAKDRKRAYLWTNERATEMAKMLANLRPSLSVIEQAFARPEAEHLLDELSERVTTHDRRAQIGDCLAELGDPRRGVGLRPDGLPDLDWCPVHFDTENASPKESLRSYNFASENMAVVAIEGAGRVRVGSFHIARFPVTYAQYRVFLEVRDGFRNLEWWRGLEASDRQRTNPGSQTRKILNHPAENVSWYDATAFCRWLSARLGYEVRLPNEAEWQLAATDNNHIYAYPWGADWRSECANTSSSRLSRTIAVGMYPAGAAPCGALDMSGNVCEWTTSMGSRDDQHVLRGGAWYLSPSDARVTARTLSYAYERLSHFGFRVACTAPHRS